jgi:acyl-CoA synthetase (AMP-forming)/AMP-acid ligase II
LDAKQQTASLTYAELDVASLRLARHLTAELGLGPGRVAALLPTNDLPSVIAIFAFLRSGCALLLLNPRDPAARLNEQAQAIGVHAICEPHRPELGGRGLLEQQTQQSLGEKYWLLPDPWQLSASSSAPSEVNGLHRAVDPYADALLFGTSGSTAASKLVVQSHYNAVVNAEGVGRHHGLRAGDRLLACLPIHHVNCLHLTVFGALAAGAHTFLAHGFDPFAYGRWVEGFRPRLASVVPSLLDALLTTWRKPNMPSDFQYFVSAAAPLGAATARGVLQQLGVRVLQGYGLTETVNFSTTLPRELPVEEYRRLMLEADIPSIGAPLFGNEVAVLLENGERARPGQVGEVCMRGHNVMMRYAGNAEATAEAFRGGWFHSQDLGFEVAGAGPAPSCFVLTGRGKNIAKVRGETVSLDEMDRALRALPQVRDAACAALPHRLLGDEIVAAVVFQGEPIDVLPHLQSAFAAAVLPRRVVRLAEIPRTLTGKVLRPQLAALLRDTPDQS